MPRMVELRDRCDVCGHEECAVVPLHNADYSTPEGWRRLSGGPGEDIIICPECQGKPYAELLAVQKRLTAEWAKEAEVEVLGAPEQPTTRG